jgi:hypothetical protein
MSIPNEADFAIILVGDRGSPENFAAICGIEGVTANRAVQGSDRYRRDCSAPGKPATRTNKITGKSLTITGSGASNVDNIDLFEDLLGIATNYKVEFRDQDGSDAGLLLGTYSGSFIMMSDGISTSANGDSSGEVTLNNEGPWTWTAA